MNDAQENLMLRYLLGELPEPEKAALEEKYFRDPDAFEQMWETENRLVDGYVRNRLVPTEREQFEKHYLASPVHRRRVSAARNLLSAADAFVPERGQQERNASFGGKLSKRLRISPTSLQLPMAAALILFMAASGWLLLQSAAMRRELEKLQAENQAQRNQSAELADQIAAQESQRDQLSAELERMRKRQTEPRPDQNTASPSVLKIFAFALSPISVRGSAGQPLVVAPDADQVQLQLTIPSGEWRSFQARIQTADRKPVWSERQLKTRAGKALVTIPADKLPFDDYILILSGVNQAGKIEEINRYSFRINRG